MIISILIIESFYKLVLYQPQTENTGNTMNDIRDGYVYKRITNLPTISPIEKTLTFTMNTCSKKAGKRFFKIIKDILLVIRMQ